MLVCTPSIQCDAHRNGDASPEDKCPGLCDADGCHERAEYETGPDGVTYCRWHASKNLEAS